ncbi:MAG: hypothetical protein AB1540_01175 [Bdellovibrionota bacterium]
MTERIRETHRPSWLPIFLGVTTASAVMGISSLFAMSFGLLQFRGTDPIALLVVKALWAITSVILGHAAGGYVTGLVLSERSRVVAAMNGLMVWVLTVILCGALGFFGYSVYPGVVFTTYSPSEAPEGLLWMAMQMGLPIPFAAAFGAMAGNDHVSVEEDEMLKPTPSKPRFVSEDTTGESRHKPRAA